MLLTFDETSKNFKCFVMLGPKYNDFMLLMNDEHQKIHVSFLHNVSTK
jgi:hypothetical protein